MSIDLSHRVANVRTVRDMMLDIKRVSRLHNVRTEDFVFMLAYHRAHTIAFCIFVSLLSRGRERELSSGVIS